MSQETDKLFEHDYDGIQEYDNPLPPWWVMLFYITIAWAGVYVLFYHVLEVGDRSIDEYQREFNPRWTKEMDPSYQPTHFLPVYHSPYYGGNRDITPRQAMRLSGITEEIKKEPDIVFDFSPMEDAADLKAGQASYVKNCVFCHGAAGEGGVGPNLTDNFWIHGDGFNDLMKTVTKGVPEKGMLAWGKLMKQDEIQQMTSYVFLKIKGTNVAGGKAPQGTEVK